jgi:hypothetical protein
MMIPETAFTGASAGFVPNVRDPPTGVPVGGVVVGGVVVGGAVPWPATATAVRTAMPITRPGSLRMGSRTEDTPEKFATG